MWMFGLFMNIQEMGCMTHAPTMVWQDTRYLFLSRKRYFKMQLTLLTSSESGHIAKLRLSSRGLFSNASIDSPIWSPQYDLTGWSRSMNFSRWIMTFSLLYFSRTHSPSPFISLVKPI